MSRLSSLTDTPRTEAEATEWLMGLVDYERRPPPGGQDLTRVFHLDRFRELLASLGNPQDSFPSVHIAGTSGKGSVVSALAAIAQAAGLRTGLYTSPHLSSFRERIQIDGQPISDSEFAQGVGNLGPRFSETTGAGFRTVFEILTALAFQTFAAQHVDIGMIETGLGGRLDCTNAVRPRVSILATLGFDHTAILGNTIEQIARDKAGILKTGIPAVVAPQMPELRDRVLGVIRDEAIKVGAHIHLAEDLARVRLLEERFGGSRWECALDGEVFPIEWNGFGPAAENNLATILGAVALLRTQNIHFPTAAIQQGLANWRWPGRLEVFSQNPPILVDGAHNPLSARALRQALERVLPGRKIVWAIGMLGDKEIDRFLAELFEGRRADTVIAFDAPPPRGMSGEALAHEVGKVCDNVQIAANEDEALNRAVELAGTDKVVVATGSLYIVHRARQHFAK